MEGLPAWRVALAVLADEDAELSTSGVHARARSLGASHLKESTLARALRRLRTSGLVCCVVGDGGTCWSITAQGRRSLGLGAEEEVRMFWDTEVLDPGDVPDEHVPEGCTVVQDWEPVGVASVWVPYRNASPDADGYVDYTVLWRRQLEDSSAKKG